MTKRSRAAVLIAGALAASAQQRYRMADIERMAVEAHPAISRGRASVRAAQGRTLQAGLYPNPVIGANGEHVAPVNRGGAIGGFVEQRIVTAGKLSLDRRISAEEEKAAQETADLERLRVRNRARMLFYDGLAGQRMIEVRERLSGVAADTERIYTELANIGMADRTEVISAGIETRKAALALSQARNDLGATWRKIGALVSQPSLAQGVLEGNLDALPEIDYEASYLRIETGHPLLRAANALRARAEYALRRAEIQKIPDLQLRGGLRENGEMAEGILGRPRRIGLEGIFDAGVEIPLFNRNQGAVAAARGDLDAARLEADRLKLDFRAMLAAELAVYQNARLSALAHAEQMIPSARQAYELLVKNFRLMAIAYPQVINAQRNLVQLEEAHVEALRTAWMKSVEIDGLLAGT
jgi:cobalt-zinc-cadmium efflux system outer membrane protein